MIKNSHLLRKLERKIISREKLPYQKALVIFEAMWEEAVHLGVLPPADPMEGIEVDLRIARIVNSCSKNSFPS